MTFAFSSQLVSILDILLGGGACTYDEELCELVNQSGSFFIFAGAGTGADLIDPSGGSLSLLRNGLSSFFGATVGLL